MNIKKMLPYLGIGLLIYGVSRLFTKSGEPTFRVSQQSDCSKIFFEFSDSLKLAPHKAQQLKTAKNAIQKKILEYFRVESWAGSGRATKLTPQFFVQGSHNHGTLIRKQNDVCDIDLAVYFTSKPPVTPATIQQHIYNALILHTSIPVTIKRKCVRIKYANLFHIDLPIYYEDRKTGKLYFGTGDQWIESDPKQFNNWVASEISPNEQLVRIIRYFKAWTDNVRRRRALKMPSGIALTVWVQKFYVKNTRDDLSFILTAYQIFKHLDEYLFVDDWTCNMPVPPNDDLIESLKTDQRKNFKKKLEELIAQSEQILGSKDERSAAKKWSKIFGKWFPFVEDFN